MLKVRNLSISKKLTWMNMLVSGVALLLACAAFFAYDMYTIRVNVVRSLSTQAQIIGSNTVTALVFNDPHAAEQTLSALRTSPHVIYGAIYTPEGDLFASYARERNSSAVPLPSIPSGSSEAHWFRAGEVALVQPVILEGKPTSFIYIRSDLRAINDRLKSYTLIAIGVLLISLVAALLISEVSQRVISKPVAELAETVRMVSYQKNYSIRAAATGNRDEVSTLIEAFNEMLAQIQSRDVALLHARDQLELRVQERTTQLAVANKELELRNREVERATQLKSKFLASMSHELRTPLNAIVGFSELLAEQTAGQLNDKQKRFVNHIKTGSAHLLQLINDILDLSKIEAGQLELHCEGFQVNDALPEVLSTIRPLAMAKNIKVEQKLDGDYSIYADRVRFKQILYNLLSNAVKFTPNDGRIELECVAEGTSARISVTDTGIGIRPEDQAMVFEEFRQVDAGPGNTQQGTGLGLAITRRLVEQQGGKLSLESEIGKGSRFTFTVPLGKEVSVPAPTPITSLAPINLNGDGDSNKPLILVVDDEAPARELLASYLDSGYRIAMAGSGAEAMEKARELQPDAITLDVMMAKGNGFEALVELRKAPETAHVPIIILSIVDQKQVGFALGASDYLIKPVRKPDLLETMRKHVPLPSDEDSSILLVDDDLKTLELLEETLRSAGYETQSVQNGARALEVLSSKLCGAVLLDLLMPGMDGFEVIRHIREQEELRELPIMVMTGKQLSSDEIEILRQHTQALFHKNGRWQHQLIAEIGRVLQTGKKVKAAGQK